MANLKNDPNYDPFPKTGYVRQFKNAILRAVVIFLKKHPNVPRQDALFKFVELAIDAEKAFKPELGYSFWTLCRFCLMGASRDLVVREQKYQSILIHKPTVPFDDEAQREAEDKGDVEFKPRSECLDPASNEAKRIVEAGMRMAELKRRFAEEALPTVPPEYGTGGNGTPITFDMKGVITGVRLFDNAQQHVRGVMDRVSSDLRTLLGFEPPLPGDPSLLGRMRAVVAHGERRQRETDQENENQQSGKFDPVFLDVRDGLRPGIKFRKQKRATPKLGARPPRISEGTDLNRLDPVLREYSYADRVALLTGTAEALRPSLGDEEHAILDWLLDPGERTLTALAKEIDITKGYASKLRGRVLSLLEKQMTAAPEKCTKLIERGCEILTTRDLNDRAELIRQGRVTELD